MRKSFYILNAITVLIVSLFLSCEAKKEVMVENQDSKATNQSVKAQEGGIGFEKVAGSLGYVTGEGADYGNPQSEKGGTFKVSMTTYPNVLRPYGPNTNTVAVASISRFLYSAKLIEYNFSTNKWERGLADYWKFENDDKRLIIRLNPSVKFSDGTKLTADDVIATHEMLTSEDLGAPAIRQVQNRFKMTKLSDYLVQIDIEYYEFNIWYQLQEYTLPKSYLSKVTPKEFVDKYGNDTMPGLSGYTLDKEKSIDQELIVLKRNPNWWGYQYKEFKNIYNFDTIEVKIIRDEKIEIEALKKGEIDFFCLNNSPDQWYGEFIKQGSTLDEMQRNMIVKRVMFNYEGKRKLYFIFNTRIKPFDNQKLRRAIALSINKDVAIDKLYHNDVVKYYSFTPLSQWVSPNLEKYEYSPDEAGKILDEIGYNIIDDDGTRKNAKGERLEFDIALYKQEINEKMHILFQEDLKKVGIKINLQITDFPAIIKKLGERDYNIIGIGMTIGQYPEFQSELLSSLADELHTNNEGGFKNAEADKLIEEFLKERDAKKRLELAHKVDEIVAGSFTYIHLWTTPYTIRYVMWNRFNTATGYLLNGFFGENAMKYWSVSSSKEKEIENAKTDKSITLDEGSLIEDPFNLKPDNFKVDIY